MIFDFIDEISLNRSHLKLQGLATASSGLWSSFRLEPDLTTDVLPNKVHLAKMIITMTDLEQKRIFLIASGNEKLCQYLESFIKNAIQHATIFTAADGMEALFKADNVFPHVLIVDPNVLKVSAMDVVEKLIHRKERLAAIILHPIPETEHFVDEVVTGQIQFFSSLSDEKILANTVSKALDWVFSGTSSSYRLRFLAADEILLRDGEKGDFVYLVKMGTLKAYKNEGEKEVELGIIHPGEFVGEMAYINGEDC